MIGLLLLAAVTTLDPCAPIEPASKEDRAAAVVYLRIGDEHLATQDRDGAIYAFRRAAELDPATERARLALRNLCGSGAAPDLFSVAMSRLDAGDRLGAVELLRRLQAHEADPSAALIEGIALFELGKDAEAQSALQRALADPALTDAATLFLGLIDARRSEQSEGRPWLDQAARSDDPHIRQRALAALRQVSGTTWLSVDASLGGGHDTNPALSASGNPLPGGDWDNFARAAASAQWRPLGSISPVLLGGASFRKQLALAAFDLGNLYAGAGFQWSTRSFGARAQYLFDFLSQGGEGYSRTHRGTLSGWWSHKSFSLSGGYGVRNDAFLPADLLPFSGWRHDGDLTASFDLPVASVSLGYGLARGLAQDPSWSYVEQGPRLSGTLRFLRQLTLTADAGLYLRQYDAPLSGPQIDVGLNTGASATWWFLETLGARTTVTWWRNVSNISAFTTSRLAASLDLVFALRMR